MLTRAVLAAFILLIAVSLPSLRQASAADCTRTSVGLTPINDLGAGNYLGFAGGLYTNGSNQMPDDHLAAALNAAAGIRPRNTLGQPSTSGRIALVSIGMSNTTQEFCATRSGGQPVTCTSFSFVGQASSDPAVNNSVLALVNGASGGQTAATWDAPSDPNYDRIRDVDLAGAGLTEAQVQAAWVKVANANPTASLPSPNADAYQLVTQMGNVVRAMRARYPNLRIVYISSRIYAGYASTTLNPEPFAYESAFAVKWVVEAQIRQMRGEPVDQRAGDLNYNTIAPLLSWAAYTWANGTTPRSDGLVWNCADLQTDGTHPANSGREKVGTLLLNFFKTDPTTRPWFLIAANVSLSGRVTAPDGRGVRNAVVAMTDTLSGARRTAATSSFGMYTFDDVTPNRTYTVTVLSKRYRFEARAVQVLADNIFNIDFSGQE